MPGIPQVVAIRVSHRDERLDGVDVLLLHFGDAGAGCQQGEAGKGLNVGISFQLQHKTRRHADPSLGTATPTPVGLGPGCLGRYTARPLGFLHSHTPVIPSWSPCACGQP